MTTYAIGDIHGCFTEFQGLLAAIDFDPMADRLWQVGDLVNGGPDSLSVLRWFADHRDCTTVVLGNHDLHFLAVALTSRAPRSNDTFRAALEAPDRRELTDWLRHCPLLIVDDDRHIAMVHAGLHPGWTIDLAQRLCQEVQTELRSSTPERLLSEMYGNQPASPAEATNAVERWRTTINVTTRMRVVDHEQRLHFDFKSTYEDIPPHLEAWFDAPDASWAPYRILCGHWSALGRRIDDRLLAIDSGCRWGGQLTALNLDTMDITCVDAQAAPIFD